MVFSILLLHDGGESDGAFQLCQLDLAHGFHHHFQHVVGMEISRVERGQQESSWVDWSGCSPADFIDHRDRDWHVDEGGLWPTLKNRVDQGFFRAVSRCLFFACKKGTWRYAYEMFHVKAPYCL